MDLATIIDEYLAQDRGELMHLDIPIHQDTRDNAKFRASDAGRCRLMRYWKRQGKPGKNADAGALRVMESGNLLHAWLNHALKDMGCLEVAELALNDEHRIGHIDAILTDGNTRVLYDFKTISGKKAYYLSKHGYVADAAHQCQVLTYDMMLTPKPDDIRIAYISRDTMEIWDIPVRRGTPIFQRNIDDWAALTTFWIMQEEPEPNPESWECTYCAYRDSCSHSQN